MNLVSPSREPRAFTTQETGLPSPHTRTLNPIRTMSIPSTTERTIGLTSGPQRPSRRPGPTTSVVTPTSEMPSRTSPTLTVNASDSKRSSRRDLRTPRNLLRVCSWASWRETKQQAAADTSKTDVQEPSRHGMAPPLSTLDHLREPTETTTRVVVTERHHTHSPTSVAVTTRTADQALTNLRRTSLRISTPRSCLSSAPDRWPLGRVITISSTRSFD